MTFSAIICDLCAECRETITLATHRYDSLTRTGMHLCEHHANMIGASIASISDLNIAPPPPVRVPAFNQLP